MANTKLTEEKLNLIFNEYIVNDNENILENLFSSLEELTSSFEIRDFSKSTEYDSSLKKQKVLATADTKAIDNFIQNIKDFEEKQGKKIPYEKVILSFIQLLEFFSVDPTYLGAVIIPFVNRDGWMDEIHTKAIRTNNPIDPDKEVKRAEQYNIQLLLTAHFCRCISSMILPKEFVLNNSRYIYLKDIIKNPLISLEVKTMLDFMCQSAKIDINTLEDVYSIEDLQNAI